MKKRTRTGRASQPRRGKGAAPRETPLSTAPRLPKPSLRMLEKLGLLRKRGTASQTISADRIFRIADHPPAVMEAVKKAGAQMAMDDFNGAINWSRSGIGGALAEGQIFLGYGELAVMAQRAEYQRIVQTFSIEMTRKWIKLTAKGDGDKTDEVEELTDELKRLGLQQAIASMIEGDGYYGRGHFYIDTGDTDYPSELEKTIAGLDGRPLKEKIKKGSVLTLRPVEAVWCYPTSYDARDPLIPSWYTPQHWFVLAKRVHISRLPTLVGRQVSDLLKPAYSFGGIPLIQQAKPYVDNWLRNRQSVSDILSNYSVLVLLTNLAASLAPDSSGADLFDRVDLFNNTRDNQGLMVLDKDLEDFKNVSTPLSTIDVLQAQSLEHICSMSGIPVVKYTGIQPAGLNADSDGVIRVFYDLIAALQERWIRTPIQYVFEIAQLNLWGKVDEDLTWRFEPLMEMTETEMAEANGKEVDADVKLVEAGVLHPVEVRQRIAAKEDSPYASLDVEDVPEIDLGGEEGEQDNMKEAA